MKKLIQNNPLILIICIFLLSKGFMLFVGGVWWDDWLIWNAPRETLVQNWITEGNTPHLAAIHLFIYDNFATSVIPFIYRVLAFSCGLISLILVWKILDYFQLSQNWKVGIMAIFASAPMNTADISICCMMYGISAVLFYLGTYLFVLGFNKKGIYLKILAFASLFLSLFFWMTAIVLIPFMLIVFALWQIKPDSWTRKNISAIIVRCFSWWYIWIVPILYWIVRSVFFAPKAQFEEYYALNIKSIIFLPLMIVQSLTKTITGFFAHIFEMAKGGVILTMALLAFVVLIVVLFRYVWSKKDDLQPTTKQSWTTIIFAVILFSAAVIPVLIRGGGFGDHSNFFGLQSRYQIFMILPISLIIYALINQFRSSRFKQIALGVVITLCIFASIKTYIQYQKGWFKQLAIVEIIKHEPLLQKPHMNVIVKDQAIDWNEDPKMVMPDYAYVGMSNLALNRDQTHRYISYSSYEKAISYDPNVDNYTIVGAEKCADPNTFHYILILDKKDGQDLGFVKTVKMTLLQYVNASGFQDELKHLLTYTLIPITDSTRINVGL